MRETEENRKWEDTLCSWIGRINTAKMSSLNEEIYRFNAILFKMPKVHFTEIEQIQNLCRTAPPHTHTKYLKQS